MGENNRYQFPFGDIWSNDYPPLSLEDTGQNLESALALDSYSSRSLTNNDVAQQHRDQHHWSVPLDLNTESLPGSVVKSHPQWHNTIVSPESPQGYKLDDSKTEEQKRISQQIRNKGACFGCQIAKKDCTLERPCVRCAEVISGKLSDSDLSQCRRWTRRECFVLRLRNYDFFKIDCPPEGNPDHQTMPLSNSLLSRSDLFLVLDSPYKVLGHKILASSDQISAHTASTIPSFLKVFQGNFDQGFAMHFGFFVNPRVIDLIQSGINSVTSFAAPTSRAVQGLQWQDVAGYRAFCGIMAVRHLLDKGLGRALNRSEGERRLVGDLLNPRERVKKFVLFLVVVGALVAARRTKELFYIKSRGALAEMLQPLTFRLAHCVVLLGTEWDFVRNDRSEQDLVREICTNDNEYVISIIRQELLRDWTILTRDEQFQQLNQPSLLNLIHSQRTGGPHIT